MNVAISGVGGGVGQAVIRALRQSRREFHLIGLDASPFAVGLYQCDESALIPPASEEEAFIEALEQIVSRRGVAALIAGTDPELLPVSRHQERLRAAGCVPIISTEALVGATRDKLLCYAEFAAADIPFARTVSARDFLEGRGPLEYPVIVKPRQGSGSVGARVLTGPEAVAEGHFSEGDVVQEYLVPEAWRLGRPIVTDLVKDERLRQEDEISMQGLTGPDGTLLGVFASVNQLRDGVPMRIRPTCDPAILAFSEQVFRTIGSKGHVGPCNVQGRITARGLVLYEANLRFTGITAVRAAMGWNEVEAALRVSVLGESAEEVARSLSYDEEVICLRYVTEEMIARSTLSVAEPSLGRN
jgi:carbamoyl-phosphate synthase large subunit